VAVGNTVWIGSSPVLVIILLIADLWDSIPSLVSHMRITSYNLAVHVSIGFSSSFNICCRGLELGLLCCRSKHHCCWYVVRKPDASTEVSCDYHDIFVVFSCYDVSRPSSVPFVVSW
jgi:hypothetical protein